MAWDFEDRLKATSKQTVAQAAGQQPSMIYYVYDCQGQRVRKVVESAAGPGSSPTPLKQQERIYLGGYEIFRAYSGSAVDRSSGPVLERTTLHASCVYGHAADIHSRTLGNDKGVARQVRFQLHNHIGTACLEIDDAGGLLGYEEQYPFGSTSYRAVDLVEVANRFRFTGKELDEENGLYFFGARYYAPWLGRWTAADPVIRAGAGSRFDYASNNPIRLVDPDGREPATPPGGGFNDKPWRDSPSNSWLGTAVHAISLPVMQARLFLHSPPILSLTEFQTAPGGSMNPQSEEKGTRGKIDLAVFEKRLLSKNQAMTKNELLAHIYDLKPDSWETMSDAKLYRYQNQSRNYASNFAKDLPLGLGKVTHAGPGSILEDLEKQKAGILDPITLTSPVGDVRITFRLMDNASMTGKVNGLIMYKIQVRGGRGAPAQQAQKVLAYKVAEAKAARGKLPVVSPDGLLVPAKVEPIHLGLLLLGTMAILLARRFGLGLMAGSPLTTGLPMTNSPGLSQTSLIL
jgi:RHS repeat-associated protein